MKKLALLFAISATTLSFGSTVNAANVNAEVSRQLSQATDFSSHGRHWRHQRIYRHGRYGYYRPYHRRYSYVPAPYYDSYAYAPAPYYYGGGPVISFGFGGGGFRGGGWGHHHRHW